MSDRPAGRPLRPALIAALLIFAVGVVLRVVPSAGFKGIGFDENLYRGYVNALSQHGLTAYPRLAEAYIEKQQQLPSAILPPTRFLYIFSGYAWRGISGVDSLLALHQVSCFFTILSLALTAVFVYRASGEWPMVGALALMAFAPTQLHMAQHALIDGFFAFWALLCLWALWECLRHPNHGGWLTLLGLSLALMVTTKENAAFVYVALGGLVIANRWAAFGTVTPRLLLVMVAGPLAGLALLTNLAGGVSNFVTIYKLLVEKAYALDYAIRFCDGPWYRYLVDLMIVSPIVLLLAIGGAFRVTREHKVLLYALLFVVFSYALMGNVKYSFNLRYANMWDLPLRMLACAQIAQLSTAFGARQRLAALVVVAAVCAFELHQYEVFFMRSNLYELVSEGLLRAVQIVK
jgi:4-amino-4-deoxy-L-arabinose transferase-like glycosyltransferase